MPSGSSTPAIVVEDLSVKYRTTLEKRQTLKSTLLRLGRPQHEVKYIEALKTIDLTVHRGEFLGIIGIMGQANRRYLGQSQVFCLRQPDVYLSMVMSRRSCLLESVLIRN